MSNPNSFVETIDSLALSQSEAASMSEAEIMARAEVIADTFIEAAVEGEVEAAARAEFVSKIASSLTSGLGQLSTIVLPALAVIIGMKLFSPWLCQLMNGGMPCPFFSPMYVPPSAPVAKPAAPAGPPAAAQTESIAEEFVDDEPTELAELNVEDNFSEVYDNGYAHL